MVYAVWIGRFINCLENNNSLNMEDSIVTQLADRLKDYKNINLNESFSMVRYDCPILSEREQEILRERDAFPRQLELKRMVGDKLAGSFENRIVNEWIVHYWGGIRRFDISDNTRITTFRDHLVAGTITKKEFARISSLSKIASFVNPQGCFVYDSRVAFALDGLLLKVKQKESQLNVKFFLLPSSQGGRDEMMRRMIEQEHPGAEYFSPNETYTEYNALILSLAQNKKLRKELPSCWIEMLLFHIGRTGGEIESLFDFSVIRSEVKQARRKQKKTISSERKTAERYRDENKQILPLTPEQKLRGGRIVQKGYDILFGGFRYYLFIGKRSFYYVELLTVKSSQTLDSCPLVPELESRGFNKKGKDYIYKQLAPYNEGEARGLLEDIKELMTKG